RDLLDGLIRDATAAGATVVMASHELDRVRGLAPRVVHVAGGTVTDDRPAAGPGPEAAPADPALGVTGAP
ncbi:MAG: heme ABC exporter ATP-binding protein CcmA, partial [Acidimicrobiales bacterium]|nr:heme ABC exporter ATP-binding protein CcmA [Acidimicrobiales bacterium]